MRKPLAQAGLNHKAAQIDPLTGLSDL